MKNETNWIILLEACDGISANGFETLDKATAFAREYIKSWPTSESYSQASGYGQKLSVMPFGAFDELVEAGELPALEIESEI